MIQRGKQAAGLHLALRQRAVVMVGSGASDPVVHSAMLPAPCMSSGSGNGHVVTSWCASGCTTVVILMLRWISWAGCYSGSWQHSGLVGVCIRPLFVLCTNLRGWVRRSDLYHKPRGPKKIY